MGQHIARCSSRGLRSHFAKEPDRSALRMRMRRWHASGALPRAGQGTGRGLVGSEPQDTPVSARGWFWFEENQTDGRLCWEKKARALLQPWKIRVGKKEMFNLSINI